MNKITSFLILGLIFCFAAALQAQSTVTLSPASATEESGDTVTFDVKATGFVNIIGAQWMFNWNSSQLEFIDVSDFGLSGLSPSTGFSVAPGELRFQWDYFLGTGLPETVPDGTTIFKMRMKVKGSGPATANLVFGNNPIMTEVIDENSNVHNTTTSGASVTIQGGNNGGTTGDGPVDFMVGSDDTGSGETVCLDVKVNNWKDIVGAQYVMRWDPAVLEFDAVNNFAITNMTTENFGSNPADLDNGILRFTWDANNPGVEGVTLPDGTTLYTVCFITRGAEGSNTSVQVDSLLPDVRVEITELGNTPKDFVISNGTVNVTSGEGSQIITVRGSQETAGTGEQVCVKVTVDDFENIFGLSYTMNWNPAILNYSEVKSFGLPGLTQNQFDNSAPGELRFLWSDPAQNGVTVADGTLIYEVCFDVVGTSGNTSDVSFGDTPVAKEAVGENFSNPTVRTFDGEVTVIGEGGFILTIGDEMGEQGDTVCVPVRVSGFNDILGFNWSINWDPAVIKFVRTQNFGLAGLNAGRITNSEPGVARVLWFDNSVQGVTLANGTILHEICFEILGAEGTASTVAITGDPTSIEVTQKGDNEGETRTIDVATIDGTITSGSEVAVLMIDVPNTQITNVNCFGEATGAIDLAVTGGVSPYTYAWSNGADTEDLSGIAAGSYTVTVTDSNGDTTSETFGVSQPDSDLTISLNNVTNESTFNAQDGAIDVTVAGGTAPYTYAWSNGADTEDISGLSAGDYTLSITDTNGCTLTSDPISLTTNTPPLVIDNGSSTVTNINCFGEATGAIDVVVSGGAQPITYAWSNGADTEDISGLAAGTYTITVSDAASQMQSFTFGVSQPDDAISISNVVVTDNSTCSGAPSGAIDLTVTGGTPNYTFAWDNGSDSGDLNGLSEGDYTVTITDANGCSIVGGPYTVGLSSATNTIDIIVSSLLEPACNGEATGVIDITVSGGVQPLTFEWTNGGNFVSNLEDLSGIFAGTYDVLVTDANGCTGSTQVIVNQPAPIFLSSINVTNESFPGSNDGAIDIVVMGGVAPYTFAWSNDADSEDLSGLAGGNYTVSITDANNCNFVSQEIFVDIDNLAPIVISGTTKNPCFGTTSGSIDVTVSGGIVPYTYSWSNGAGNVADQTNLGAGSYTVTVQDEAGQSASRSFTLTAPQAPIFINNVVITDESGNMNDGSVNITPVGGQAPYSFVWSNGANTEDIVGLSADMYRVTITDANGCVFVSDDYEVEFVPFPILIRDIDVVRPTCPDGEDGRIEITVAGGSPSFTFTWSNDVVDVYSEENPVATLGDLAAGSYEVTITDRFGQAIDTKIEVEAPNGIAITSFDATPPSGTPGNNGSINIDVSGGRVPYTFAWNTGATSEDIAGLTAGEYRVTITDNNGCVFVSQPIIVGNGPLGLAAAGIVDEECPGSSDGAIDITPFGGKAPYTYSWSNDATTEDLRNVRAGIYGVTVTDSEGNSFELNELQVESVSSLALTSVIATTVYNGGFNVSGSNRTDGSAKANVSGGISPYIFKWSAGTAIGDGSQVTGLPQGTHSVTVTDGNGCEKVSTVTLSAPSALTASMEMLAGISCSGECTARAKIVASGGVGPYTYQWDAEDSDEDLALNLCAGIYNVTITDANNISYVGAFDVQEPAPLSLETSAEAPTTIETNDGRIFVNAIGGTAPYEYVWNDPDGCTDPNCTGISYTRDSLFVVVRDANGCMQIASVAVPTPPDDCYLSRPIITPDGDGLNDLFIITCVENVNNNLKIFNRWGQLVFQMDNYDNSWNGTNQRGSALPEGGYFYVLEIDQGGETLQIKGSLSLLKEF